MVSNSRKLGDKGEDTAADFYISKNYSVLTRNFVTKIGEIDLICMKNDEIVFVEVKIENPDFPALERVNRRKFEKIKKNAQVYLKMYTQYDRLNIRFDLIIVDKFTFECDYYPGVYFD
ncbi:YraN family protein [bacterium]|nr:YraN family protein [bacterium]